MNINNILDIILNQRLGLDEYGLNYLYPAIHKNLLTHTLPIFSQHFPCYRRFQYEPYKHRTEDVNEFYFEIPEVKEAGFKVISIANVVPTGTITSNAAYDMYSTVNLTIEDVILNSAATNTASLAKLSYRHWRLIPPNRIRLKGYGTNSLTVELKIAYPSFNSVAESVIEQFLNLACADVAIYIYNKLKHYDQLPLPIGNIDLKLDALSNGFQYREEIINSFNDKGFANKSIHHAYTYE